MFVREFDPERLIIETPAKVNLFLQVLNRRDDGYHNINSLFQAVSLYDRLEITIGGQPGIEISQLEGPKIPVGEDNLISRAYRLMQTRFGLKQGMKVGILKQIPVAAGLAGGSSDAAATIKACNLLANLGLTNVGMASLGLEIGSDLPFFFSSGQVMVGGRGEIMVETDFPTDYSLILVTPNMGLSTAQSYRALKRGLTTSTIKFNLAHCRTVEEFVSSLISSGNDFEEVHQKSIPVLGEIADSLMRHGAQLARMSGSGPTMFGLYSTQAKIKEYMSFYQGDWLIHVVRPVFLPDMEKPFEGGSRGDN